MSLGNSTNSCMSFSRYTVDETSPEETFVEKMFDDPEEGYTYEILCKKIASRKPLKPTQNNGASAAQSVTAH